MTPQALAPALFAPLIVFAFYRRFRRNFGRQAIQHKRMVVRIVLLSAIAIFMLVLAWHASALFAAGAGGLALGAGLATLGLKLTRFESNAEGEFYTPNTYIGVALSAALIGRLVYRFVTVGSLPPAAQQAANANPFAAYQSSPLTLAIFTVLMGYYVTYYIGVMLTSRKHNAVRSIAP
ncbi:MAG TPA: hypothetical protein VGO53_09115 [Steroidobacteraceae bacterium]|nr:hypothetical protein [Steroidobacteraceae bacterium]